MCYNLYRLESCEHGLIQNKREIDMQKHICIISTCGGSIDKPAKLPNAAKRRSVDRNGASDKF